MTAYVKKLNNFQKNHEKQFEHVTNWKSKFMISNLPWLYHENLTAFSLSIATNTIDERDTDNSN